MTRTIITLPDELKEWLDNYSHIHHQSLAETIRCAIKEYKKNKQDEVKNDILYKTSGIWKNRKIDGLEYVENLRKEWE